MLTALTVAGSEAVKRMIVPKSLRILGMAVIPETRIMSNVTKRGENLAPNRRDSLQ
jgi:hypothetical protein